MNNIELPSPKAMSARERAAEITAILARSFLRRHPGRRLLGPHHAIELAVDPALSEGQRNGNRFEVPQ